MKIGNTTLTKRGETAFASLVLSMFILLMGVVGGIEQGTLPPFNQTPPAAAAEVKTDAASEWKPIAKKTVERASATNRATRNRDLGKTMAALAGWEGKQWKCLSTLWTRESGWNDKAVNRTSGAAGIPQNITGGDAEFRSKPHVQIKWGLEYIKHRYGSPCAALRFHDQNNWY